MKLITFFFGGFAIAIFLCFLVKKVNQKIPEFGELSFFREGANHVLRHNDISYEVNCWGNASYNYVRISQEGFPIAQIKTRVDGTSIKQMTILEDYKSDKIKTRVLNSKGEVLASWEMEGEVAGSGQGERTSSHGK